jgi:hypothetical protein
LKDNSYYSLVLKFKVSKLKNDLTSKLID